MLRAKPSSKAWRTCVHRLRPGARAESLRLATEKNGSGVNAAQYNPIGTNCGDGMTFNRTCYLVPNPTFGTLQSVSQSNGPHIFQFAIQYRF